MKKLCTRFFSLMLVIVTCCLTSVGFAQLPVFPGAMGHGTETIAGRGGKVIKVTNLNNSGAGSLRAAVSTNGPRTIVFEVSGTITLSSDLVIGSPYCTLAGQTAPSPGINLRGAGMRITTHDVLVQHIRIRVGDAPEGPNPDNRDALQVLGPNAINVVVDHISVSWAIDENLSTWYALNNVTFSNCIVSESLYNSTHSKGPHGMAFLLGDHAQNVTFISNMLAHNSGRNPLLKSSTTAEIVNNLVYNIGGHWNFTSIGAEAYSNSTPNLVSVVGNKFISGHSTPGIPPGIKIEGAAEPGTKVYANDNISPGPEILPTPYQVSAPPVWHSSIVARPSSEVEAWVAANAGARPADRDAVDTRVVNEMANRTGSIINSQGEVGGWPVLAKNQRVFVIPDNPHGDDNGNGYTNIEEVLHQMAADVEPGSGQVAERETGLSVPCPKAHFLIMAQQPDRVSNQPAIIAQNIKHIESMPFDGMFINSEVGWKVMKGAPLDYGEIEKEFAPLKNVFKKFKSNFLMVYINYPGDFWDDKAWETTAKNFGNMAKVARELGCVGIVYDNEEYSGNKWLDYGGAYKNEKYSLEQTRDKVISRGKQVMEAMVAEFPEIEEMNCHGPYLSEPNYGVPKVVYGQAGAWDRYELLGPFFVGMMQGKGKRASVTDGGEVYQYRSKQDFMHSYDVRKYEIAGEQTDSWFISREMRKDWANNIEIAFGVYNRQWKEDYPMDPEIMKTTLANALQTTDKYVWYYTEGDNWILPGKMPAEWVNTVREARNLAAGGSNSKEKDKKSPFLIMAQRPNASGYPAVLIKNIEMVESHPFDGIFLNSVAGWNLMKGDLYSYGEIYDEFAVLKGAFKKFTHNFIYVFIDYPGDFWDDGAWGITAQNFANMAMVAKELGCKGIVFDNEEYLKGRWLDYKESYENPAYDFLQHRDQVMLRGKQVMEAMVGVFPGIEVFNYHGPYLSEPKNREAIVMQQSDDWDTYELLGPFFIGMMQGRGNDALVIDGGEVYQYRTLEDFQISYQWRKHDIASEETGSWMVPEDYRSRWADNINISFGVYNRSWKTEYPMNVGIMRTTLANALQTTDKYVWYYTESDSWLIPCRMPREWTEMVREVKSAFD